MKTLSNYFSDNLIKESTSSVFNDNKMSPTIEQICQIFGVERNSANNGFKLKQFPAKQISESMNPHPGATLRAMNEELFTVDSLRKIYNDAKQKHANAILDAPEEFRAYLRQYVINNDKGMIPQMITLLQQYSEIKKAVNFDVLLTRRAYRGLANVSSKSDEDIKRKEKENWYVAGSTELEVAKSYAKGPGGAILCYRIEPWNIIFDLKTFKPILDVPFQPEVVFDVRDEDCILVNIDRL